MTERPLILVLGATGLFGGLLANRIARENRFTVIGASRTRESLDRFSAQTGATSVVLDHSDTHGLLQILDTYKPFAVVDCAGPFQYYGEHPYRFAQAVVEAGCHYIDIADATDFVAGFHQLDFIAKENSVSAISGVSSTPAISAAVADHLSQSLKKVVSIDTAIVPGNRTRRTLSVMQAIIGQVGQPFKLTRDGREAIEFGWSKTRRIDFGLPLGKPISGRLASLVNTPDVKLFPQRYNAQSVSLRAGLEVVVFHRILQLLAWLVRLRLISSLVGMSAFAQRIASWFKRLGSDLGGMQVIVVGQKDNDSWCKRTWELVASDGDGPEIPTLPVSVLLEKLHEGTVRTGARASLGELRLDELIPRFNSIESETRYIEDAIDPLFASVLGDKLKQLPPAVQQFHNQMGTVHFEGCAESKGPTGISGRLAAWMIGVPKRANDVPITVTLSATPSTEHWTRNFAGATFHSNLSKNKNGAMQERFGPLVFQLDLYVRDEKLFFPVHSAHLFGLIPLPRWALPKSIAHEGVDEKGRFRFDIEIRTPFNARIAHYRGWLKPAVLE